MPAHPAPQSATGPAVVLRGPTPWALPFLTAAVVGWVLAVLALLWTAQAAAGDRTTGLVLAAGTAAGGGTAWALRRGCRVVVRDGELCDQVAYRTVHRVAQSSVQSVHVAAGGWRWFVVELDDGRRTTLVGTGPLQFPARLFDPAGAADLRQIDALMGPDPTSDT